ncbi:ATP-binding cassette domain-containing protein [Paraflavitalea sp. CAU 1676]|uniref:ABC transporter ATP-binding protein n=1 Tax=Paraflavitalea sp. CAU 1676 TaxID=3032598 RepID=UPI0023DB7692|nr:ATP-binding cassette domain-containing protein [Paraflavitalea sp. CAU 1676]MDF2192041.1 ATP-binding cassette domain-containing protein [Paraflavitalea sp. CAU 1676]
MHTLEAINLSKQYGEYTALNGLHLSLKQGDIFCLLGQNGAGKTTTLNIFLGFIAASGGEAKIMNTPVSLNGANTRQYLAYIPEVVQLYPNLTGIENLDYFSRLAGFSYSAIRLPEFLLKAGLQEEAHKKRLHTYSKGMRQKVGIAIALAKNAQVIFMDEPTSGLDPKATQEFTDVVKELGRQGKTILMATHDIFNAVNVGTHIGIMKSGSLVHSLSTSAITANALQQLYLETI